MKSLTRAMADGLRAPEIKASIERWLGMPITLTNGEFWRDYLGAGSFIGRQVSVDQALQLSAVWACVRLISETLASLPLGFYERNPDGSRSPATRHPLYEILHNQPNADMTAVLFWEIVIASMLLWGNAYVEVFRSSGAVISLQFLMPARVTRKPLPNGGYVWLYRDSRGIERVIPEDRMMHIMAFSIDGICGLSPIAYGANVFGTAYETDKASAETFEGSLKSPGLVTMDMTLRKDQREEIRAHVKKVSAEGGVMVLEKGAGFQKLGFDPVTAQLLESRRLNIEEICRWFGIDPVMVGHGNKDSNWGAGLEQKMIWFLMFALRKWCVRIEQAVRKSLLTPVERQRYFAEWTIEGLLRADSAARAAFFSIMVQNGIMTRDECRKLENWPPMGGNAEVLTVQSNMLPIDRLGQQPDAAAALNALVSQYAESSKGATP